MHSSLWKSTGCRGTNKMLRRGCCSVGLEWLEGFAFILSIEIGLLR